MLFKFIIISVIFTSVNLQDACLTPNNETGKCIPIKSCAPLLAILQQRPLNQSSIEFLRNSNCGYENSNPKVCCKETVNRQPFNDTEFACGVITEDKILGGTQADLDEFPWLVLFGYTDDDGNQTSYRCMGALINHRFVLTAAHCLAIRPEQKLVGVRLGEYDLNTEIDCVDVPFTKYCSPPPLDINIEQVIIHEKYDRRAKRNDIGLVKLAEYVPFSDFIQPICLPNLARDRNEIYTGRTAFVSGWGRTSYGGVSSEVKLKVLIPIISNEQCNKVYKTQKNEIDNTKLCAGGEDGKDSCQGDTGGPLMVINKDEDDEPRWYSIGIVSYGKACGIQNIPVVHTKISEFIDWIYNKIEN